MCFIYLVSEKTQDFEDLLKEEFLTSASHSVLSMSNNYGHLIFLMTNGMF